MWTGCADDSVLPGRDPGSGWPCGRDVSGCVLALRILLTVVQYTIKASDHPVDDSGCVQVSAWEWDGLFEK